MVLQCKPVSGWKLRKRRSAPSYESCGLFTFCHPYAPWVKTDNTPNSKVKSATLKSDILIRFSPQFHAVYVAARREASSGIAELWFLFRFDSAWQSCYVLTRGLCVLSTNCAHCLQRYFCRTRIETKTINPT